MMDEKFFETTPGIAEKVCLFGSLPCRKTQGFVHKMREIPK
jgi:hypothetical protein